MGPTPAITESPLIISSGLTNCTSYQIKLRAVNNSGSGVASAAATLTPALSSSQGINWVQGTSAANNDWYSVTYGNGLFVAVANTGIGNQIMTSPDGITWTARTPAGDNFWISVTFGNNLFVAVANFSSNQVMTSPDGITWTIRTSAANNSWVGVTFGNGLFVAVAETGTGNRVMTSQNGITWTIRTSAADNRWRSVTFGNGLFVAVAQSGTGNRVMTSPDGITWASRTSAADNLWVSVTYGNGLFVAVAYSGTGNRVMTSPDGITWTSRTSAADNNWSSVTFGNGLFVAVSQSGIGNRVMTSQNGITWIIRTSAADNQWQSVTYGKGLFVAVSTSGTGNRVMTSSFSLAANAPLITAITARNNAAIVNFTQTTSANSPAISNYEYSTDNGNTWIARNSASNSSPFTITGLNNETNYNIKIRAINTVGNSCASSAVSVTPAGTLADAPTNLIVTPINTGGMIQFTAPVNDAGSNISNYEYSTDNGVTWVTSSPAITESPLIINSGLTNCTSYQIKIRAVNATGSGVASAAASLTPVLSTNQGTNWELRTSAADNNWYGITYGNGLFVAVGFSGTGNRVMTSPDGITWTSRTSAADNNWNGVTYGNGLFVAVANTGTGNRVMTSPDGIAWTSRTSAADISWRSITYGNGLFVAVAYDGTGNGVMTSPDGITWTSRTPAVNNYWNSVTYGNGLFVAVGSTGSGNRVMTSGDGITWTSRTSAVNNNWTSVTYGNGLFVAVAPTGLGNRVMTSPNGITWTSRTSAANNDWYAVTYGNGLFVAVATITGTGNRVMTSSDGITWTSRTSPADNNWYGVTYGNGLFVAVAYSGTSNRVMTSSFSPVASAPVITSATFGSTVNVNFTQSSSLHAPSVSNYQYSTDNGSSWTALSPAVTTSPLSISGFVVVPSSIMLRAVNSVGNSCPSIAFGASTISVTGLQSFAYTASAQGPSTNTKTGSTGAVTYSYSGTGSTTYPASSTAPTVVGTYQVIATVAADANYASASSTAYTFSIINSATSNITVTGLQSFIYNGSAQGPSTNTKTGSTGAVTYNYSGTGSTTYPASATAPTVVGNYQVVATLAADANYASASSTPYTFSITTASSTIVVTGSATYTYSGSAQGPSTNTKTGSTGAVTYSYSGTGSTTYPASATAPTVVGTYQVIATLAADANYVGASSTPYTFSITIASSTIVVTGSASYTYSGSAQGPSTNTKTGTSGAVSYSYSGTGLTTYGPSTTAPTVVGTYQVVATLAADANYNGAGSSAYTFSITSAASTINVTGLQSFIYNGSAQGPSTNTKTGSSGAVTYSYSGTESTTYGASSTAPSAAGTYQVVATLAADAKYASVSSNAYAFSITSAVSTISVTGLQSFIYSGSAQGPSTNSKTGSSSAVTYSYSGTGSTTYTASSTAPTVVGTYQVVASLAADANYVSASSSAYAFSITRAASTISVTGLQSFAYNGSAQGPSTNTKTGSTGAVTYSYSGTGSTTYGPSATAPTAIGTYQVIATVAADANYVGASSSAYAFSITIASSTILVTGSATYTYSGSSQGPSTNTKTGSTGAVTYSYSGTGSTTYPASATAPTAAGTYQVIATIAADANYASASSTDYTFSITSAASTISVTGLQSFIYNGIAQGPSTNTKTGSTRAITYSYSGTGSTTYPTSATAPTVVGTYQVIATLAADANYASASSTAYAFSITIAASIISVTGLQSFIYSGSSQGPSTNTKTGSSGAVTYSYSGTGSTTYPASAVAPSAAGTYQVIATVAADANYVGASSSAYAFSITNAASTISVTGLQSFIYSGSAQGPSTNTKTGSSGAVTYSYSGTGSTTYPTSATAPTIVGTYQVIATVAADANYASASSTAYAFSITSAASTISVTGLQSFTFSGSAQGPSTNTKTGSTGAVTYSYSGTGSTTYGPSSTAPTVVGTYQVIATVAADANFASASSTAYTFSIINSATSNVTVTGLQSFIYNGSAQGPSTNTKTGSTGAVTYSYSGTRSTTYGPSSTAPTVVGTYQVIATLAADANYSGATSPAYTFSITIRTTAIIPGTIGSNQTVCSGNIASMFTSISNASGVTDPILYKWQQSNDSTTFTDIVGATQSTYNPILITSKTFYKRVAYTNNDLPVSSNIVSVNLIIRPTLTGSITGKCAMNALTTNSFQVVPVANATSYAWTLPNGFTGNSTSNNISIVSGNMGGIIRVIPYNETCSGNELTYVVSVVNLSKSTLVADKNTVPGNNLATANITMTLYDSLGNRITCTGGLAGNFNADYGTINNVKDNNNGTFTATIASSADTTTTSATIGGLKIKQTIKLFFTGPQGGIQGNIAILATESPKLSFQAISGVAPFTLIYRSSTKNTNDTLFNVIDNGFVPLALIDSSTTFTLIKLIDKNGEFRDRKFLDDTAFIKVLVPKIITTLKANDPKKVNDSTFAVQLSVKTINKGEVNFNNTQTQLNLSSVFPSPVRFILDSVRINGSTVIPNLNYDGINNTDLYGKIKTPKKFDDYAYQFNKIELNSIQDNIGYALEEQPIVNGLNDKIEGQLSKVNYLTTIINNQVALEETANKAYAEASNNSLDKYGETLVEEEVMQVLANFKNNQLTLFGGGSGLPVGAEADAELFIRLIPNGYNQPFVMQATAIGTGFSPSGNLALSTSLSNDNANASSHPELTKKGEPLPTVLAINPKAIIGVALSASTPLLQVDNSYDVDLKYTIVNYGNLNLQSVNLYPNLASSIPFPATYTIKSPAVNVNTLVINNNFDSKIDSNLLAPNSMLGYGKSDTVVLKINIKPNAPSALYTMQAYVSAKSGDYNLVVRDSSTNGLNPDLDGNGLPTEFMVTQIVINKVIEPLVSGKIGIVSGSNSTVKNKLYCSLADTVKMIPLTLNTGGLSSNYLYQWQYSQDGKLFRDLEGKTDSTLNLFNINTSQYIRRVIIEGSAFKYSDTVFVKIATVTKASISYSGSLHLSLNGNISLTSSVGQYYNWSNSDTTSVTTIKLAGIYKVLVTDSNGCKSLSDSVIIYPPSPVVSDSTYILGGLNNPTTVAGQVNALSSGKLQYYNLLVAGSVIATPLIPSSIGNFKYYVSQVVNGIESDRASFAVTILDPNKLSDLQKVVSMPAKIQESSDFLVGFKIYASNLTTQLLDSVRIEDNLSAVFPSPTKFQLISLKSSGKLITNPNFDGISNTAMLLGSSQISPLQRDSIELILRVIPNGYVGILNNQAKQLAKSPYGNFIINSNDPTKGNGLSIKYPTSFLIPLIDVFIPDVFTPNRDGINDRFVIIHPSGKIINLTIFNRWGQKIYANPKYNNEWDGKGAGNFMGNDLPEGTYFYFVEITETVTGQKEIRNGYVTLKR